MWITGRSARHEQEGSPRPQIRAMKMAAAARAWRCKLALPPPKLDSSGTRSRAVLVLIECVQALGKEERVERDEKSGRGSGGMGSSPTIEERRHVQHSISLERRYITTPILVCAVPAQSLCAYSCPRASLRRGAVTVPRPPPLSLPSACGHVPAVGAR